MAAATAPAAGPPPASVGAAATPRNHAVLSVLSVEGVPDEADAPRERTGIKISLDGVGAVITARRGASKRAAAPATPREPEEGAVDDKNVKILLQDVRVVVAFLSRKVFSNTFLVRALTEGVFHFPLSSNSVRPGDGRDSPRRHVRGDGPERRRQDHTFRHREPPQDGGQGVGPGAFRRRRAQHEPG
jgi:hypothetical protein